MIVAADTGASVDQHGGTAAVAYRHYRQGNSRDVPGSLPVQAHPSLPHHQRLRPDLRWGPASVRAGSCTDNAPGTYRTREIRPLELLATLNSY